MAQHERGQAVTIHVGFTGTRIGMSVLQCHKVELLLDAIKFSPRNTGEGDIEEVVGHHGLCEGADMEFDQMCADRGFVVDQHPGPDHGPLVMLGHHRMICEPKPHLARNRDIVDISRAVIAAPPTALPQVRGGTWSTINYAREVGRPCAVVRPDGSVDFGGVPWPWELP